MAGVNTRPSSGIKAWPARSADSRKLGCCVDRGRWGSRPDAIARPARKLTAASKATRVRR